MLKQILLLIFLFILVAVSFTIFKAAKQPALLKTASVAVGNSSFYIEVADNFASRAKGLSGHAPLTADQGMLFIFQIPAPYPFWMKDMTFPLDIIWIRANKVIGFAENAPVPSGSDTPSFSPPGMVDMVLEVNSGVVKNQGINVGDEVAVNLE